MIEPDLPFFLLIRENHGTNCRSTLQRKILERVLYEGTQMNLDLDNEEESFLHSIFARDSDLELNPFEVLNMRWYSFPGKAKPQTQSASTHPILQIYSLLVKTIDVFSSSVREYLRSYEDPLYFIQEYCAFWSRFCQSIFEMEFLMKDFTKVVNETYERDFPAFPKYPRFSIMRLMIKIWLASVYIPLKDRIFDCFQSIVRELRKTALLTNCKNQNEIHKVSEILGVENNGIAKDNYYKTNIPALETLGRNLVEALTDISVNELSVRHLGHSKFRLAAPFSDLEERFHEESEIYYQTLSEILKEDLPKLEFLLREDCKLLKPVINEKISKKLKSLKCHCLLKSYRKAILKAIQKSRLEPTVQQKSNVKPEQRKQLLEILKDVLDNSFGGSFLNRGPFLSRVHRILKKNFGKVFMRTYCNNVILGKLIC